MEMSTMALACSSSKSSSSSGSGEKPETDKVMDMKVEVNAFSPSLADLPDVVWRVIAENLDDENLTVLTRTSASLKSVVNDRLKRSTVELTGAKVFSIMVKKGYLDKQDLLNCAKASPKLAEFSAAANSSLPGRFSSVLEFWNIRELERFQKRLCLEDEASWEELFGAKLKISCGIMQHEHRGQNLYLHDENPPHDLQFWAEVKIFLQTFGRYLRTLEIFCRHVEAPETELKILDCLLWLPNLKSLEVKFSNTAVANRAENSFHRHSHKLFGYWDERTLEKLWSYHGFSRCVRNVNNFLERFSTKISRWGLHPRESFYQHLKFPKLTEIRIALWEPDEFQNLLENGLNSAKVVENVRLIFIFFFFNPFQNGRENLELFLRFIKLRLISLREIGMNMCPYFWVDGENFNKERILEQMAEIWVPGVEIFVATDDDI